MKRILVVLALLFAAPTAFAATPSCSTFDDGNHPAANFEAGDRIVVRGTGFAPNSLVLVSFQQGTRTAEISHLKTNDLGAFATDASSSRLPSSVDQGPATIQVFQGAGAASCDIGLVSAKATRPGGLGRGFYLTWGILLTLCAVGLAFATVRRWQADRLSREMEEIEWQAPDPAAEELIVDDAPLELLEFEPDDRPMLVVDPDEEEPIELDEPGQVLPNGTSDAVAQLRRDVRAWKTR